jgi:hypothetical protein
MKQLTKAKLMHKQSSLIDALGGTAPLKEMFAPISDAAISKWRYAGVPTDKLRIIQNERPKIYKQWQALQSEAKND